MRGAITEHGPEDIEPMFSERGLTHALRQHLAMLGRDPKEAENVLLTDGSTGRLDLMLSAKTKEHDRIRHLVVELKAPAVKATDTGASQIKKYARAVVADRQFEPSRDAPIAVNSWFRVSGRPTIAGRWRQGHRCG